MKKWISVLILLILLTSCKSTYITSTWKANNVLPVKFKKLVVLALVGESEQNARQLMEKHLVDDLKNLGYDAVCSCEEFGPGFFKGLNEKEAVAKLKKENVDGILTIVLLDIKKEKKFIPGKEAIHSGFYDYYQSMYRRVNDQGYYVEDTKYFWESNLYDLSGDRLLSSIQSQSFEPESAAKLAHEYGQMIVKQWVKESVLVKNETPALKPM